MQIICDNSLVHVFPARRHVSGLTGLGLDEKMSGESDTNQENPGSVTQCVASFKAISHKPLVYRNTGNANIFKSQ